MYIDACIKELEYSNIFLKCYKLNIQEVTKAMLDVKVHISENTKIANFKHPLPSKKNHEKNYVLMSSYYLVLLLEKEEAILY